MKGKVIFIDTVHPTLQLKLEELGYVCTDASEWDEEKISSALRDVTGIVIRNRIKIDAPFLEKCLSLKFIARAGAGMENIDRETAELKNIVCLNAPEGNRNAVAEHALGMLLALLNKLINADKQVRNGIWLREDNRGIELDGKTIGIIGFGNTGTAFAKKLKGFDCKILVFDPYVKTDFTKSSNMMQVNMQEIFHQCDVVSLHVPLTVETLYLVNENFIRSFRKPFYLINTSRGKVVNTSHLTEGLSNGIIAGAALDVLEFESFSFENLNSAIIPEGFKKLIDFQNVILSPHVAGWSIESYQKISEVLADKIRTLNHP